MQERWEKTREREKPESGGCVGTAFHVSNNKPEGVIKAGYNIMQAQNMH